MRLLELVRRELGADDAHLQLGGRAPDDPRVLLHDLRPGCRLIIRFDEAPADPAETRRHLVELAAAFSGTVTTAIERLDATLARAPTGDALTDVLADLRDATAAAVALVVDRQSPVIWGCSDPDLELRDRPWAGRLALALARAREGGDDPVAAAGDDAPRDTALHALHRVEQRRPGAARALAATVMGLDALDPSGEPRLQQPEGPTPGLATKTFGGLYEVVLVFTAPYSPLRVEGVMRRALPVVERLVLELPPLDPKPKGGRVVPLRRD